VTECGIDIQTRLCGAQVEEWNYSLGTYSALEWILELYKEKRLKDPTIVEKFNTYRFADYREQMIDPLRRVTTVSLETRKIVRDAVICRLRNEKNAWTL
jgi:predicted helicase